MSQPNDSPTKTVLVTGGSGYIGSVFVDYYAKRHPNHRLVVLSRTSKPFLSLPANVQTVLGDYGDRDKVAGVLQEYNVTQVLHMAAELDNNGSNNNVAKSKELFAAMADTGVKQIVYTSSLTVYQPPSAKSDGRLSENSPVKPSSTKNYAESKRAVEDMLFERKEWRSAILRYAIVVGSSADSKFGDLRQNQGILSTYLYAARDSRDVTMPDDGSAMRDFIDVQDIASATDKALSWVGSQGSPRTIALNVGSGKPHSINRLIRLVEQVSYTSIRVNRSSEQPGVPISFLDTSLISKTLDWEPRVNLDESVKNAWKFLVGRNDSATRS